MTERLYRSSDDRMLAGVAGGLAEMLDADPSIIRIVWALLVVLTGGLALLVYVVMAVVVPEAPPGHAQAARAAGTPTADGDAGATAADGTAAPAPGGWVAPDGSVVPMAGGPTTAATPVGRRVRRGQRDRSGGLIAGSVLIAIGAFFLLRQLIPSIDLSLWWPAAAIGLGIVLVVAAVVPSRRRPD